MHLLFPKWSLLALTLKLHENHMCERSAVCAYLIPQIHAPSMQHTVSYDWCVVCLVCSQLSWLWLCVYISCSAVTIRRSGKMEEQRGGDFSELFKNCFSHVIHASIWLPHCWQSSCVLTNMSVCLCFNVCFHRCFGHVYLSWFCLDWDVLKW